MLKTAYSVKFMLDSIVLAQKKAYMYEISFHFVSKYEKNRYTGKTVILRNLPYTRKK